MAVAHVTTQNANFTGGGASTTLGITVSGTNPVLIAHVCTDSPTNTIQYPTSVTWSLGGTLTKIKEQRNTADGINALGATFALAAPTAGAGTLTFNFDISDDQRNCDVIGQVFSGADQTTPCPLGDAVAHGSASTSFTLTPTSLASGDATTGCAASTVGVPSSASPNQRLLDNTGVGALVGDATDTTGVTFSGDADWGNNHGAVAVRIVAAAGGGASDFGGPSSPMFRVRLRQF